ncbi:MarR family transcriptional regulator [uncultured Tateyamaria sp.]|uniref:MarR family winged helix-turn-helix transcriptional regulator n=1 Tax=uncultured Tateyamaria sp. TaxID=455651 RepID=UPI00262FBD7C|nr:MarR family transcriptional regulator [uncultured Tateyamaria sp.]
MEEQTESLHKAVTALMRALKIAEKNLQVAHRELNFVAADIATLRYLTDHPDCMLSDLASHLGVVPTTASSVIDRLAERGFVSRERPETNRRSVALRMTPEGQDAFALINAEERQTMKIMLDALPEADREQFVRSMTHIAESVSSRDEE